MSAPSKRSDPLDRRTGRSAFGDGAKGYHQSRSGYPPALFEYLTQRSVPSPVILEIGAGTGLASEGLLACNPSRLVIVEPDPRMCSFLDQRFNDPRVSIHPGSFPDIAPDIVSDGPFDLIACAAAFHWMEPGTALARIKELLAPGGVWAMWWNVYLGHGEDDPLANLAMEILRQEGIALPPSFRPNGHYALDIAGQTLSLLGAGFRDVEHRLYRSSRELNPQQARQLFNSFSFISVLAKADRERILDRISGIVASELGGRSTSIVVTSLYTALC